MLMELELGKLLQAEETDKETMLSSQTSFKNRL